MENADDSNLRNKAVTDGFLRLVYTALPDTC